MNIREVKEAGASTSKIHEATVKLRGIDVDLRFGEPMAGQMQHMQKYLHLVTNPEAKEEKNMVSADLNQSNLIQWNTAAVAFTLLNNEGELEFGVSTNKGLDYAATVDACGAFLYGKDKDGNRAFSNEEISLIVAEAKVALGEATSAEDHAKN